MPQTEDKRERKESGCGISACPAQLSVHRRNISTDRTHLFLNNPKCSLRIKEEPEKPFFLSVTSVNSTYVINSALMLVWNTQICFSVMDIAGKKLSITQISHLLMC